MSEKHDPLADPLDDYWRQKVEEAAKKYPVFQARKSKSRRGSRSGRKYPAPYASASLATPLVIKLWEAGVPLTTIASVCGLGRADRVSMIMANVRLENPSLSYRGQGWQPRFGWRGRLDDILKTESLSAQQGVGGSDT